MTYNFDPEAWAERQRDLLRQRRAAGELDEAALQAALAEVERRLEEMWARLDGSYRLPRT
ncbi:MAG: hypothetical protein HRF46_15250 [Acidobacteriota bacterium]